MEAQPQPPRDPDTKKLLPETAQTKASWSAYRTAISKWNSCRANKGLATVTPTQPPPTPTPTPTPVPPSTSYADALIADWPQMASVKGKVTDEKIALMVCAVEAKFKADNNGWTAAENSSDPATYSPSKLKERIAQLLIAAQSENFSNAELAVLLGNAYGETRFGVQNGDGLFSDLKEENPEGYSNVDPNYHGRGYIQTTGTANYQYLYNGIDVNGQHIQGIGEIYGKGYQDVPEGPALLEDPKIAAHAAVHSLLYGLATSVKIDYYIAEPPGSENWIKNPNPNVGKIEFYGLRDVYVASTDTAGSIKVENVMSANGYTYAMGGENPPLMYRDENGNLLLDKTRFFVNSAQDGRTIENDDGTTTTFPNHYPLYAERANHFFKILNGEQKCPNA